MASARSHVYRGALAPKAIPAVSVMPDVPVVPDSALAGSRVLLDCCCKVIFVLTSELPPGLRASLIHHPARFVGSS